MVVVDRAAAGQGVVDGVGLGDIPGKIGVGDVYVCPLVNGDGPAAFVGGIAAEVAEGDGERASPADVDRPTIAGTGVVAVIICITSQGDVIAEVAEQDVQAAVGVDRAAVAVDGVTGHGDAD